MKVLGNSLHIANSGKLIARSSQTPITGAIVYNRNKKKIGKINFVFGPTRSPYVSIRLFKSTNLKDLRKNYGEQLFVSKPKSNKKGKRKWQKKKQRK